MDSNFRGKRPEVVESYCQECTQEGASITVIKGVNDLYNDRLKGLISKDNNNYNPIDLGCPSRVLLETGLPNLPIQVSVQKIFDKKHQENHPFSLSDIAHLPEYVGRPIAVFRSASALDDVKVVLTEMQCNGVNMVVIIAPDQYYKGYQVNSIRSIYPKDNIKAILRWITEDNLLEYVDKKKFLDWLGKQQSNSADVTRLIEEAAKIVNKME